MATAPHGSTNKGMEVARLRLACAVPGEQPSQFSEALRRLGENAAYLYNSGENYWFSPIASLNQEAEDRAKYRTELLRLNIKTLGQQNLMSTPAREKAMKCVLRGYAKDKDGNLILVGTMPVPHSKDKASPRERKDKRHLVRQGATIFKREIVG